MSNITVTHAESGLVHASVVATRRVTPHMQRITLGGGTLDTFAFQGYDQWFRLAVPVAGAAQSARFDNLPDKFGIGGYLRFQFLPKDTRPVIRNYTVRAFRPAGHADNLGAGPELDIDFVVHGTEGVAGPWAAAVAPDSTLAEIAFIDQGCGWKSAVAATADEYVIVADESALPAAAGILRNLPRDARGHAVLELFDTADRQELGAPDGVEVHWVERAADAAPGSAALPALAGLSLGPSVYAFAAGESAVATGARRQLVTERGIPKTHVTFCGYWKAGAVAGH